MLSEYERRTLARLEEQLSCSDPDAPSPSPSRRRLRRASEVTAVLATVLLVVGIATLVPALFIAAWFTYVLAFVTRCAAALI